MKINRELLYVYLKKIFILSIDTILVLILLPIALYLRVENIDFQYYFDKLFPYYYITASISYIFAFFLLKTHRVIFKIASIYTAIRVAFGAFLGSLLFYILSTYVFKLETIPRSVFIIQFLLFVPASGIFRFYSRIIDSFSHRLFKHGIPTLVYGAGINTNRQLPSLLNARSEFKIFGILDDSIFKKGVEIHGIKVLGNEKDLPHLIKKYRIEQIIISMPSASGERVRYLVKQMVSLKLKVKILPSPELSLQDPDEKELQLRDIKIEDLLKRTPRSIDKELIKETIENKVVLITGAGGSIGSELVRQILALKPTIVIMNDSSEFALYKINEEVESKYPSTKIYPVLANIADDFSCRNIFNRFNIDIIFHACAYKHVPLVEDNISSAAINNIKSAFNIFSLASKYNIEKVVLISSDKAIRPTNVMGATKRICELLLLWHAQNTNCRTNYSSVRFGNVLGSNGSVVPKFIEQIKTGGPITITHPDITRYFMLIPEAVALVLQAATAKKSGEIFILNMGNPIKIVDMAKDLIQLMGKTPDIDIKIKYTGLRSGEKLFEELNFEFETMEEVTTDYSRISDVIKIDKNFINLVQNILNFAQEDQDEIVKSLIFSLINKYEKENKKINYFDSDLNNSEQIEITRQKEIDHSYPVAQTEISG
ncbi:nucleoside-diphosphate sugar epimerase/dehydratase [Pigmentibacter ruber]|uniref:nucleoside-diphosphate sugar epimerase/dehydratase n=1 Tax=Pigmentibacter ruber TaxID=2683196 RepID=UPI00131D61F8|nr:nucleoside-diphosphate sugar epimerase/dehydratase [Pigmentibacter ruber]BFD31236.1 nucleoside-diphosphate sugar epimerase/dehydratase [Pigmentibacter ruber]